MIEFLIFVCALSIIVPSLFITALFYNANRSLRGEKPLTIEQAIVESFKTAVRKAKNFAKSLVEKKTESENKEENQVAEDAEFREVNE